MDVTGYLPEDAGYTTYAKNGKAVLTKTEGSSLTISRLSVDTAGGEVSFTMSGGKPGDVILIPLTLSSANYADASLDLEITLQEKQEAELILAGGEDITKTYGDADFTLTASVPSSAGSGSFSFSSSAPEVAGVTSAGRVHITGVGSTVLTAEFESETHSGTAAVTLTVDPKTLGIRWSNTEFSYDGETHSPVATLSGVVNGDSCTVNVSGSGRAVGSYTATASLSGTDAAKYRLPEDCSCSFRIESVSLADAVVTLGAKLSYNGREQTQSISSVTLNGKTVAADQYTVTDNKGTSAGSYTLTVTAKENSNYSGSVKVSFTIEKKQISPKVSVNAAGLVYDGEAKKPAVSVKDGNTLLAETDYHVAYSDNVNAGTAAVTVTEADGNYAFEAVTVNFTIGRAAHEDVKLNAELKYGLSGSVELAGGIEDGGTPGALNITDSGRILEGTPVLSGTRLSFAFADNADNNGKSATVSVAVTGCDNYQDYNITVILTVISCAHEHTEVRDAKDANCTEEGYSGDIYCADCGRLLEQGSVTQPLGHSWSDWEIILEPSCLYEGKQIHHCTRCGHKECESLAKTDPAEADEDLRRLLEGEFGELRAEEHEITDESGHVSSTEITLFIGSRVIGTISVDHESGEKTVETSIWAGGLKESYHYSGKAIRPEFVLFDGVSMLKAGRDYSVSYKNNRKVGATAEISLSFKGDYKETEKQILSFTIVPAVLGEDVLAADTAVAVKGKTQKPVPALSWAASGKRVSKSNFSVAYTDAAGNAVDGIGEAGVYTVTLTAKNGNFSGSCSAQLTVVNDKKLLLSKAAVKLDPKSYTYTGEQVIPVAGSYTLTLNGQTLVEGVDYTVSGISNNVNAGNATITFRAVEGNEKGYAGSKSAKFKISKGRELKEGEGFSYVYETSVPYAQGGAKPSVTVKDGEKLLLEGKDYTLSYSGNKALTTGATATVTVKGKGNYRGSVKLPFAITAQQIAAMDISVADKTESAKGYKAPSVTVSDTNGKKLKAGRDYELCDDYTEPDAEGKVTVSLRGLGNYEGSVKISYRYIKASQQLSKVKAKSLPEKSYTGRAVTLSDAELTGLLSDGEKVLVPGTDFEVLAYSNNLRAGTAKVTLRGLGAYGGTLTLKFKIKGKKGGFIGSVDKG